MQDSSTVPPPALALLQRSEAARHAMLVVLFGALTAVSAQIAIPTLPVPVTGTVLLVLLSGVLLGPRLGLMSQVTYLCFGMLGAPVFAGGKATALVFLGPTAGYLLAYPFASYAAGRISRRAGSVGTLLAALIAADVLILLVGGLWLGVGSALVQWPDAQVQPDLGAGLVFGLRYGVLPFLPVEAVKVAIAAAVAWPLAKPSRE